MVRDRVPVLPGLGSGCVGRGMGTGQGFKLQSHRSEFELSVPSLAVCFW